MRIHLIDRTYRAAVEAQIEYGRTRGTPWGISESGYNRDGCGIELSISRLWHSRVWVLNAVSAEDLVIAPYASVMALMVAPREACENLQRLAAEDRLGDFGFYEAVDYTPSRLPPNETSVTIRSFMVHHQGMSLLVLRLSFTGPAHATAVSRPSTVQSRRNCCCRRRVPKTITTLSSEDVEYAESRGLLSEGEGVMRVFTTPHTATPEVHLLSNGRYHVIISNSGGGYSRWHDLAVTRWREDATRDCWGSFCYLRDFASGEFWSIGLSAGPGNWAKSYEAIFTQARAEFRQRHGALESHIEISVSPEDDVELRRLTLTNHSNAARTIELTTYAEVVLAPAGCGCCPSRLQQSICPNGIRRRRIRPFFAPAGRALKEERPPWLFHLMTMPGRGTRRNLSFETDRAKFIGRGRNVDSPLPPCKIARRCPIPPARCLIRSFRCARTVTIPAQAKRA